MLVLLGAGPASAAGKRFAVTDISSVFGPQGLLRSVASEVHRLRPELEPLEAGPVRDALLSGEGADARVERLLDEARTLERTGDCASAVARAREAENAALEGMGIDAERDVLKGIYALTITCADRLGQADTARAAATRLRDLVSMAPSGLAADLWTKYAPAEARRAQGAGQSAKDLAELQIDSEPPHAPITINFHAQGSTPNTLKIAAGQHLVEVEKEGYKKAFRLVDVKAGTTTRTSFRLIERAQDRADQIVTTLRGLRGADPLRRKRALSRLVQAARVDVLVLVAVHGDRCKIWFFDAERGDLTGDPIDSPFDATSFVIARMAERPTPSPAPAPAVAAGADGTTPSTAPAAGAAGDGTPRPGITATVGAPGSAPATVPGLPESEVQKPLALPPAEPWKDHEESAFNHWYTWVAIAAVVGGFVYFVKADEPTVEKDLDVTATWPGVRM